MAASSSAEIIFPLKQEIYKQICEEQIILFTQTTQETQSYGL